MTAHWEVVFRTFGYAQMYPFSEDDLCNGMFDNPDWGDGCGYQNITDNPEAASHIQDITQDPAEQIICRAYVPENVKDRLVSGNYSGVLQIYEIYFVPEEVVTQKQEEVE